MTKDTGGPAFPHVETMPFTQQSYMAGGMTLRDWFAGMAMAQLCVAQNTATREQDAETAYTIADAMIAERSKP